VAELHGNLTIANMDVSEFARSALEDPDGVRRGYFSG
jgi:hypothetical protein